MIPFRSFNRSAVGLAALLLSAPAFAGTITGGVAFPGDSIPALTVVAVEQTSGRQYSTETKAAQRGYRLELPEGRYIVFAIPHGPGVDDEPDQPALRGAYSAFSVCVLNTPDKAAEGKCDDHALMVVEIVGRESHKRIDLYDWYLPESEKGRILAIEVQSRAARR